MILHVSLELVIPLLCIYPKRIIRDVHEDSLQGFSLTAQHNIKQQAINYMFINKGELDKLEYIHLMEHPPTNKPTKTSSIIFHNLGKHSLKYSWERVDYKT